MARHQYDINLTGDLSSSHVSIAGQEISLVHQNANTQAGSKTIDTDDTVHFVFVGVGIEDTAWDLTIVRDGDNKGKKDYPGMIPSTLVSVRNRMISF